MFINLFIFGKILDMGGFHNLPWWWILVGMLLDSYYYVKVSEVGGKK